MSLAEHYQAAYHLDPKAARLALSMLERARDLPFPWRFAIRTALTHRARYADRMSVLDVFLLSGQRLPWPGLARRFRGSLEHRQARQFVRKLCDEISTTSDFGPLVSHSGR